jgi:hypothetical protein
VESAGVVDLIDKAWKIGGDVFESFVVHQIDGLDLKGLHEALGLGIVIGIATSAHGADETMFGQQVAIRFGGVLRPTIRVVDAALRRLLCSNSRLAEWGLSGSPPQDLMKRVLETQTGPPYINSANPRRSRRCSRPIGSQGAGPDADRATLRDHTGRCVGHFHSDYSHRCH